MNTSIKETEALFVIVFEYETVKSFAIRVRGVKFTKMSQNNSVSLTSKSSIIRNLVYHRHFHYDDVIIIYVNVPEPLEIYIKPVSKGSRGVVRILKYLQRK